MTTAAQKRFINASVELGCVVTGNKWVHFHHCVGRKAKHNKTDIGEWFGIPLAIELHDIASNHPLNITHHKSAFVEHYDQEANLWLRRLALIKQGKLNEKDYPPVEVVAAITDLIRG